MPIRVLIVDDSRIVRGVLKEVLRYFPDLEVVGEAGDGKQAERLVHELRPDVVTLDILMPMMGGVETIETIMRKSPTSIVVVADVRGADRSISAAALAAGAVGFFPKPRHGFDGAAAQALADTLRKCAGQRPKAPEVPLQQKPQKGGWRRGPCAIVGIVASTGGPRGLKSLLQSLPRTLPCPIAIVQHTTAGTTEHLARWLSSASGHQVTVARQGQRLEPGEIVVAPDGAHLTVAMGPMVALDAGPPLHSHRPSGTILLKSLAAHFRAQTIGVVLSGMGTDGAEGLAAIEAAGGAVLVEQPSTAILSGMPAAALAQTTTALVEPAPALSGALLKLLGQESA